MNAFIKKIEASGWRLPTVVERLRELSTTVLRVLESDIPWLTALADALFVISAEDTIAQAEKLQAGEPKVDMGTSPPVGPFPMEWEEVDEFMDRRKVFGGWLVSVDFTMRVCHGDHITGATTVTFVPDPHHQWKLEGK